MLFHHDARNYEEAASAAADNARRKMQEMIDKGKAKVGSMIKGISTRKIDDRIIDIGDIEWDSTATGVRIVPRKGNDEPRLLHRHALQQATDRLHVPIKYVEYLQTLGEDGHRIAAMNLARLAALRPKEKVLLRRDQSHDRVLGFLSDRYRRIDTPTTLDAFAQACHKIGAVPVEGYTGMHTRTCIKALLPVIFEPVKNEVLCLGLMFENSDYGDGACNVRVFILRLWCTNFAITENALREIHLGKRLSDNIEFSQKTYELDAQATASAITDVVGSHLSPDGVNRVLGAIKEAHEANVDPKQIDAWLKKNLTKEKAEMVKNAFVSADIENLPAGQNAWRLSNALSWIANQTEDEYDKLDLMKLAGKAADVKQVAGLLAA